MTNVNSNVSDASFDYEVAFSRNLGWVTPAEQKILRKTTVGIAGLGGVGGYYAEALARLGVGGFVIADFDHVELANFNRQACALIGNLGRKKSDVISERIREINPTARVEVWDRGLASESIPNFVDKIDVYVDGLDFFVLDIRQALFQELQKKIKTGITVAPIGMGASLLIFDAGSMGFDEYFQFSKCVTEPEKALRFLIGLAPSMMQRKGLVYPEIVDIKNHRVPSVPMGVFICAGVAATEVLKAILGRGPRRGAPCVHHFDAYSNRYKKTYVLGGNRSPLQKLKIWIAGRQMSANAAPSR